uniref:m7GpppN-mRNA hydrolase NUDT17 n=1 Tax=Callorhinchus milii TaxID=7868 RepID=V9L7R1_CALMI
MVFPCLALQSVTGHFSPAEDQVTVHCHLHSDRLILSDSNTHGGSRVLLKRAAQCPISLLRDDQAARLPAQTCARGVEVAVAVVLQSLNDRVLLTRRAAYLHSFPNIWVPPGGHVELNEELLEAGLRELKEETGLELLPGEFTVSTLGLWESVYPPRLSRGLPERHHIVVYLLLRSTQRHEQLQARLQPCEEEVGACAWLEHRLVEAIVATPDGNTSPGRARTDLPATLWVKVFRGDKLQDAELPVSSLLNQEPRGRHDVERVSSGTKFALQVWLSLCREQHT